MRGFYFTEEELSCRCKCGLNNVTPHLVHLLDILRERLGRPVVLTSASRCIEHNRNEGGSETSSHLLGLAVDIAVKSKEELQEIRAIAEDLGVTRFGEGNTFLHIDIDTSKTQNVTWGY